MALVMSSPILCSSKSLDGPSGELPESPFTFSQALQKVKAVFPNGSPVPTKYEAVAPCSRKRSKDRRARGQGQGLAFRRASAERAGVRSHDRRPAETCRAQPGSPRVLQAPKRKTPASFSAKQLRSLAGRCAPRFASACPQAVLPPMRRAFRRAKKGESIRAPGLPPQAPSRRSALIPVFCLSSPSLL